MSVPLLSVLTLCIFLITVSKVAGQAGLTQQACKASDPKCDRADDICFPDKCVRKAGGNCSSTPDVCASTAPCVSGICKCIGPLIEDGEGQCVAPAKRVGGSCNNTEGEAACDDPNASCHVIFDNLGYCECSSDYLPTLQLTCERAGITMGRCKSTQPFCENAQDVCFAGKCVIRVGGDCSSTPDGCTALALCVSNVCTCMSPWTDDGSGQCESRPAGATKGACKSSNPQCDSTDDVCFVGYCVTRVGGNCNKTPGGCTTGASCVSDICTCNAPLTDNGFGQCAGRSGQVGGVCKTTEGAMACLDPGASCKVMVGDLGVCACREGYQPTLQAKCVRVNRRVGGGCELKNGRFACLDPNAECQAVVVGDGGGVCTCRDTHVPARDGTCKLTPGSTTAECVPGGSCTSLNDTCIIDRCKTKVGRHCSANEQCVSEAYCNQTTLCNCIPPYHDQDGLCVAPAGLVFGPCDPRENGSCADPHAVCLGHLNSAHCFCKDPYFHTADLACKAQPGALHGLCDDYMQICDDVNAECRAARCNCKDDYVETFNNRCLPRNQVGVRNGVCGLSPVCSNPEDRCSNERCKIPVDQDCSQDSGSCAFGATCQNNVCRCLNGLTNVDGLCFRILRTLGGTCDLRSRSGACEDSGAECAATGAGLIGVCVCVDAQATMDGKCSSVAISASLMLVVLAFMTSHLI